MSTFPVDFFSKGLNLYSNTLTHYGSKSICIKYSRVFFKYLYKNIDSCPTPILELYSIINFLRNHYESIGATNLLPVPGQSAIPVNYFLTVRADITLTPNDAMPSDLI